MIIFFLNPIYYIDPWGLAPYRGGGQKVRKHGTGASKQGKKIRKEQIPKGFGFVKAEVCLKVKGGENPFKRKDLEGKYRYSDVIQTYEYYMKICSF